MEDPNNHKCDNTVIKSTEINYQQNLKKCITPELLKMNDKDKFTYILNSDISDSDDANDSDGNDAFNYNSLRWNKCSLKKYVKVIKAYDKNKDLFELSYIFKCSIDLIENILNNRHTILKIYEKYHCQIIDFNDENNYTFSNATLVNLNLDERIMIIKGYVCNFYTYFELACLFQCSLSQIKYCISNRKSIIQEYKRLHPSFDDTELIELGRFERRLKITNAYKFPTYQILNRRFSCSPKLIKNIIQNEKAISEQHLELINDACKQSNKKDVIISRHKEVLMVLEPLQAYAELVEDNFCILDLMSQLKKHILKKCIIDDVAESANKFSSLQVFQHLEISSYRDAFNALKPIGNYAVVTQNSHAIDLMAELGVHLIKYIPSTHKSKMFIP